MCGSRRSRVDPNVVESVISSRPFMSDKSLNPTTVPRPKHIIIGYEIIYYVKVTVPVVPPNKLL